MVQRRFAMSVTNWVMGVLLLASCGTTPTATTTTAPSAATVAQAATVAPMAATAVPAATVAPAQTAVTPATAQTARVVRWRTAASNAAEQAVYERLNTLANAQLKDQNIVAVYDPAPSKDYGVKLKTELAGGTAPDIFWVGSVELADYIATEQILDLKPLADADSTFAISDFYAQPMQELSRDGKLYGLPRDISTLVTYYNEDLFKAANLPTPKELAAEGKWNLETMLETARKLTDPTKQQYGIGFNNWWGPGWGFLVSASGGDIVNAERTACTLNTPEAVAGITLGKTIFDEKLIPPADGQALFNAGKVGMYFNGRWFTPGVRTNATFAWDVAEMPQGKRKATWLFWGPYLVNAKTADADATWQVLKVLTSAEAMADVASQGTSIPARNNQEAVDAFLQSNPPMNNQAFLAGTEYAIAEAPLWSGSWADYNGQVQTLWDKVVAGELTPTQFGEQVCTETASAFTE